jgi:hypothetical protein
MHFKMHFENAFFILSNWSKDREKAGQQFHERFLPGSILLNSFQVIMTSLSLSRILTF